MNIHIFGALILGAGVLAFLIYLMIAGFKIINEHYNFLERERREAQIGEIK